MNEFFSGGGGANAQPGLKKKCIKSEKKGVKITKTQNDYYKYYCINYIVFLLLSVYCTISVIVLLLLKLAYNNGGKLLESTWKYEENSFFNEFKKMQKS